MMRGLPRRDDGNFQSFSWTPEFFSVFLFRFPCFAEQYYYPQSNKMIFEPRLWKFHLLYNSAVSLALLCCLLFFFGDGHLQVQLTLPLKERPRTKDVISDAIALVTTCHVYDSVIQHWVFYTSSGPRHVRLYILVPVQASLQIAVK